jgi:hypothetical protein
MAWYISKLVFRVICGDGAHMAQFDEQWRLICATNDEEAFEKSREIARNGEDSFLNEACQLVSWKFINVAELNCLSRLEHGAEIFSRIIEVHDGELYSASVNMKAASLAEGKKDSLLQ